MDSKEKLYLERMDFTFWKSVFSSMGWLFNWLVRKSQSLH
jgi:hypothetical protein